MSRLAVPALLASALLLAGCATPLLPGAEVDAASGGAVAFGPQAVVAFIDAGINPYHVAFRDDSPRAYAHPSTYLPGYPTDAVAVNLTFDAEDLRSAIEADCAEWAGMEAGVLYWFPGTRVVGATYLLSEWYPFENAPYKCGLDEEAYPERIFGGSHGTMVASRGAGNEYGACPSCLVVMVQGYDQGVKWASEQPWIDAQSNSWGPFLPAYFPVPGPYPYFGTNAEMMRLVEEAAARQPSFWASGNGAAFRFGVLGHPTQLAFHMTPSVLRVGGHDSGRVAVWPGSSPHVVSDACWSWAAEHDTLDESTPRTGGGTSGATPFVAGAAGQVVLDARRILGDARVGLREGVLAEGEPGLVPDGPLADGAFTKDELLRVLFALADPRPDRIEQDGDVCEPTQDPNYAFYPGLPVEWRSVPEGPAGIPFVGYGAVTPDTMLQARAVLEGAAALPPRPDEDAFLAADRALRQAEYDALA